METSLKSSTAPKQITALKESAFCQQVIPFLRRFAATVIEPSETVRDRFFIKRLLMVSPHPINVCAVTKIAACVLSIFRTHSPLELM